MKNQLTLLLSVFTIFSAQLTAQSDCNYFHRKNCGAEEGMNMKYDSQSKSAVMAKGQTSEFHMVAYNGLDYRISVCADELIGTEVQFKIYEKERVRVKPEELQQEDPYQDEQISNEEEDEYADETYDEYSEDASYDDSYSDEYSDSYSDAYAEDSYGGDDATSANAEKPQYKLVKEMLYDNASNSYASSIEFTADGTMSLIIEVTIPGNESAGKLKIKEMGCVGVLVEHTKSKNTGF